MFAPISKRFDKFGGCLEVLEASFVIVEIFLGNMLGWGRRRNEPNVWQRVRQVFGITGDWCTAALEQWTTAAQDEGEWRRTAEQGAEQFMAKWIAAEKTKAGLRHAVVCPNVTGRTNERIAQSKRARAGSLAIVD